MLLLFGTRAAFRVLATVTFACSYCGRTAPQRIVERANRFTLFFLPLFTISRTYFNQCTNCSGVTDLTAEQARRGIDRAALERR
jgi:zinc-ribbon family